jgi:uncharacterized protein (DUF302 family)
VQGIETTVYSPLADAEAQVRDALSAEGFGVLAEIDVAATLKAKLGVDRPALKILGACNPTLAHRALELDPSVALVLPCNVVLEELGPDRTRVTIADPRQLMPGDDMAALAAEAADRVGRVSERLAGRL